MSERKPALSPRRALGRLMLRMAKKLGAVEQPQDVTSASDTLVPSKAAAEDAFVLGRSQFAAAPVAVKTAIDEAARRLAPEAARLLASIRVAIPADLSVHADPRALDRVLCEAMGAALRRSPCSAILVTARPHGARVEIAVLGDGAPGNEAAIRGELRDAEAIVALHGGSIEIDTPAAGASIRLRLPTAMSRRPQVTDAASTDAASVAPSASNLAVRERQLEPGLAG